MLAYTDINDKSSNFENTTWCNKGTEINEIDCVSLFVSKMKILYINKQVDINDNINELKLF